MHAQKPKRADYIVLIAILLLGIGCQPTAAPTPTEPTTAPSPAPTHTHTPDPPVTLVVPTPVPYPSPEPTARPDVSSIRRIIDAGVLRVGIKLNAPPFGTLDREGNIVGYDADIAHALAESWGVELKLVQVTNQTAIDYLLGGEIDLLIAAWAHRREEEAYIDFSQSYFPDGQAVLVGAESTLTEAAELAGKRVGVTSGSYAEEALDARGLSVELSRYEILDDAITALMQDEIDAVVDTLVHLRNAQTPGETVILDTLLADAPLAIGLPRYDTNLRNALNRTLHALESSGRLLEIHNAWFGGYTYPGMVTWESSDERSFADYPTDMVYAESMATRIQDGETLRVAGLSLDEAAGQDENGAQIEAFYRGLVEAMAARWGAEVEFLPGSREDPAAWVADGRADLAIGVEARWDGIDAVEYGQAFLLHGHRLMVRKDSPTRGFGDLIGKRVGVFGADADADEALANEKAEAARLRLASVSQYENAELAMQELLRNREDAVFGDSLALGPLVEAHPDTLRFTERFYSRHGVTFAVPRGDADFRALVNFTLQDLVIDGTYARLYAETLGWAEPLPVEVWPGDAAWLRHTE